MLRRTPARVALAGAAVLAIIRPDGEGVASIEISGLNLTVEQAGDGAIHVGGEAATGRTTALGGLNPPLIYRLLSPACTKEGDAP